MAMRPARKKKHAKDRRKKIAKQKVKRTQAQLALCTGDKLRLYNWFEPTHEDLYVPDTIVGVIIHGSVKQSKKKQGRIFVDLCNGRCWNLLDTKEGLMLDHKTHVRVDGDVIKLALKKYEDRIRTMV